MTRNEKEIRYIVQVGSFRRINNADNLKTILSSLGIKTKIKTIKIDNRDTWHRVQVGLIIDNINISNM